MRQLFIVPAVLIIGVAPAFAQDPPASANQPDDEPVAAEQHTRPEQSGEGWLAQLGEWMQEIFKGEKPKNGFYPEFDGLPPGSGISAGPGYRQQIFDGHAAIDGSAAISWYGGTFGQLTFEAPALPNQRLLVGAQVKHQDFTPVSFFGIGPASLEADGSDYRLKNTDSLVFASAKPRAWLTLGGRFGYTSPITIERPRTSIYPPTQDVFTAETAPGLVDRPAFLHGDLDVDVDTRNHAGRPTSGGDYRVSVSAYSDRDFGAYSFRRIEGEASQFIPILHENWVIALRARVAASDTSDGNIVPFYLLPTLGGSQSLRGYEDYRFRDRNALLLSAEYRWRVFGALDGALFYDGGKVAPRFDDLDLTHLKSSYGLGFRFHSSDVSFFRVDVGHSVEGTRLFLSLTDALRPGHRSIVIPYVP